MLRINDPQKHKVLYIWELYDIIIKFPMCTRPIQFVFAEHYYINYVSIWRGI